MLWTNLDNRNPDFKNRFTQIIKVLFVVFCVLNLFFSNNCKKRIEEGEITYPLKTAQMVSQVTAGVVSSSDKIRIRFVAPMIEDNLVGQTIKKPVFSFNPSIEGSASWEDRRTLIFQPYKPLPLRETYQGTLDMAALLPKHKEEDLEPLKFKFEIAGREIASIGADFKLKDPNNPRFLLYEGTVVFTEKTSFDAVEKGISLRGDSRELNLTWDVGGDGKTFTFTSSEIERGDKEKEFILKIEKKHLDISGDYKKSQILTALEDMRVLEVKKQEEGNR